MAFCSLVELLDHASTRHADRPLFGSRLGGGWSWTSYRRFAQQVDHCRAGLAARGMVAGDRVAIISGNRVEWAVLAHACYSLGATLVPMYQAQTIDDWRFIIDDCQAKALLCESPAIFERTHALDSIASLKCRFAIGLPADNTHAYERLLNDGRRKPVAAIAPAADDLACLIYTSGTTGLPKGVMLSHGNICSNVNAMRAAFPIVPDDRSLSFLPWAHSFGQTCELHTLMSFGASMALCDNNNKIVRYLREVQPTLLISVPRIFNRIYAGLAKQMAKRPRFIRGLFERGMELASAKRTRRLSVGERLQLEAADRLVFSLVRDRFGGRLKYAFSGGAALSKEVALFIDNLGITVYEGYGLSEAGPVVSSNRPSAHRIGSVGKALRGVRIDIDIDAADAAEHQGEIVVHGPNVMQGYWGMPQQTAAALTPDGGLRTGDLGHLDQDGFLFITGRVKEQYKLENGKYVVPAALEEQLKLSPYILNVMIYGANKAYNVALVVVDIDALARWADKRKLSFSNTAEMLQNPRVVSHIMAEIGEHSSHFKKFQRIKKAVLIASDFTTENGMLTPTLKIRRHRVMAKYGSALEALY